MGLRERKKEQTRRLIGDTAWRMFADRGFDQVTVAEVAKAAEVSVATVFNYFPVKEDLFFSGLSVFGDKLRTAVADRAPGEPAIAAVRDFLLDTGGLLDLVEHGDQESLHRMRTVQRVIAESPTLVARERDTLAAIAAALAEQLAEEAGGEPADHVTAHGVAAALLGVHRALVDLVRRRVLADERLESLATDVRAYCLTAFDQLAEGLRDYATKS
jgi:AcrR family transcriptional regulator